MGDVGQLIKASSQPAYRLDDYIEWLRRMPQVQTTMSGNREELSTDFLGIVGKAYRDNGIVFACVLTRMMLFSEARFQFQQMRGRPGDLFGTPDLAILEQPEPKMTTGDLLARVLLFADLGGTGIVVRRPGRLRVLRPDWVTIVIGSMTEDRSNEPPGVDSELAGIIYHPGGRGSDAKPQTFLASEVALFAPIPDGISRYTGMSAITAVRREIMGDSAATTHKLKFFENAATPNLVVKLPASLGTVKAARDWIGLFEQEHEGAFNAYKTAYLGHGMEVEAVGKDMQQLEFKATQGAGETRIVAAMNLHPTVVPVSEGLAGSSLNAGNFGAARRLVANKFLQPYWRNVAGSFGALVPPPPGSRLWYDARDVPFLAEDVKERAEVFGIQSTAVRTLTDGGYEPASVIAAVAGEDITLLRHTGLLPVQLQTPGAGTEPGGAAAQGRSLASYRATEETMLAFPEYFRDAAAARANPRDLRATRTFWPTSGFAAKTYVEEGEILPSDAPVAVLFPEFFEVIEGTAVRVSEVPRLGSGQVVSTEEVLAARTRLREAGKPSGYESIARELGVSRDSVRRRLRETTAQVA
jgi:hypothetical protein